MLYQLRSHLAGRLRALTARSRYGIKAGYAHRTEVVYFDDTPNRDEYQKEVYEHAARLFREGNYSRVLDLGCGAGYKLVQHFSAEQSVGFDLPPTLAYLRRTYPTRQWCEVAQLPAIARPRDLLICADVIEHVPDPDQLLRQLQTAGVAKLIISTPERDLVRGALDFGPPKNKAHAREWSFSEFRNYVDRFFVVEKHWISHREQGTQVVQCRPRH